MARHGSFAADAGAMTGTIKPIAIMPAPHSRPAVFLGILTDIDAKSFRKRAGWEVCIKRFRLGVRSCIDAG